MRNTIGTLSAAILLGLSAPAFAAQTDQLSDERAQAAQADMVFVGSVAGVDYRMSGDDGDAQRIPHTFVTYNVEQVLHGTADSKQVTLRFVGGRGEKARFLSVSGLPMFDKGDRDLLMVANNGISGCPLVDCSNGRYRFIQGKVFSEAGQAIEIDADGNLTKTGYYNLPEVMTHKVSQTTMTLEDHFEQGEERIDLVEAGRGAHMDDAQMIARVKDIARGLNKATPAEFKSASAMQPFSITMDVAKPPAERDSAGNNAAAKKDLALSAQERAEEEALRASGGDPAIGEFKGSIKDDTKGEKK